jgi:uncharacterized protein YecE (DUF72 family)
MKREAKIYIGTSGWSYKDWTDGVFYPPDTSSKDWLKYYSGHFNTVEVNASFYRQMSAKTYAKWRGITPKDFKFSVKMSRYLTHIKKLNSPEESWERFIAGAGELRERLGPVLFQLPPIFKVDVKKLEEVLQVISVISPHLPPAPSLARRGNKLRIALEFRDESWFCGKVYDILKKYNASLVFSDTAKWPSSEAITADFIYIRMHGPSGLYDSKYTDKQLNAWAEKIKKWSRLGGIKEIYVYFNNDYEGYAIDNAETLWQLLGKHSE